MCLTYVYGGDHDSSCSAAAIHTHTPALTTSTPHTHTHKVAALHGHAWTKRALDAIAFSSADEEEEAAWEEPPMVPASSSSSSDPSEVIKPVKKHDASSAVFRVRLRVAGGRELVYDAGEIEGLEVEGAHLLEMGAC
jgi:hypothetical protein